MPRILSLETSTSICSAALHDEGKLLAVTEIHQDQSHGSKLAVIIDQLATQTGLPVKSYSAIALSKGPGSYTGLRIGTSTAKGLAYSLNIPLIAISTMEILAWKVARDNFFKGLLCPMLDARRMEVYCSIFSSDLTETINPVEAKIIDSNSFSELLDQNEVLFFGPGAEKCKGTISHSNAAFLDNVYPSASMLGELAWEKYKLSQFEDLVHFEPMYLKEFLVKKSEKVNKS